MIVHRNSAITNSLGKFQIVHYTGKFMIPDPLVTPNAHSCVKQDQP